MHGYNQVKICTKQQEMNPITTMTTAGILDIYALYTQSIKINKNAFYLFSMPHSSISKQMAMQNLHTVLPHIGPAGIIILH